MIRLVGLSPYLLGVDGGGTQTTAAVASSQGKVLGVGQAGSANYHNVGRKQAARAVSDAAGKALRRARLRTRDLDWACVGLAALNVASDFEQMAPEIVRLRLAASVLVVHDSMTALAGANARVTGAVIVAGTGTVAAAVRDDSRLVRVGGWGSFIDDEGSAYYVGRSALKTVFRALDGRGPKTSLTRTVSSYLRVEDPESIHRLIYEKSLSVEQVAGLSTVVAKAAQHGDQVAKRILSQTANAIGLQLKILYKKTGRRSTKFTVRTVGGLFEAGPVIVRPLRRFLRENAPSVRLLPALLPPVGGALIIAAQLADPEAFPVFIRNLKAQRSKLRA